MTIQKYHEYQLEAMKNIPKYIRDEDRRIKFAVNIDIEDWKQEVEDLTSKLPQQLLYDTSYDALRFLPTKIKGVNLPQVYMKVIIILKKKY